MHDVRVLQEAFRASSETDAIKACIRKLADLVRKREEGNDIIIGRNGTQMLYDIPTRRSETKRAEPKPEPTKQLEAQPQQAE